MFIDTIDEAVEYLLKFKNEYFKNEFDAFESYKCLVCDIRFNLIYEGIPKCKCTNIPEDDRRHQPVCSRCIAVKPDYGLTIDQTRIVIVMYQLLKNS